MKWTALEVIIYSIHVVLNMTDTIIIQKLHAYNYVVYKKYLLYILLPICGLVKFIFLVTFLICRPFTFISIELRMLCEV